MAKKDNDVRVKFMADTTDLNIGLRELDKKLKTVNKEFKANTAKLENWKTSEDGLKAKLDQLNATLKIQEERKKKISDVYKESLDLPRTTAKEILYADEIQRKYNDSLLDARAAYDKTQAQINKYNRMLQEVKESTQNVANSSDNLQNKLSGLDDDISLANAEFKESVASMDDWKNSSEGLQSKVKQLTSVLNSQIKKAEELRLEYERVSQEQGENSTEAKKLRIQYLNQKASVESTTKELKDYKGQLSKVSDSSKKTKKENDKLNKSMKNLKGATDQATKGFTVMRGALSQLISGSIMNAVQSIGSAISSSRELRKELGMLNATATTTGSSFDKAKENLIEVSSITDDAGAAVEGLNNLMTAGFDGKALDDITDLLVGASIKWKDTLKFEGLSDGLQETLATGKAIGPFAEMLERAGVNLDTFNSGLAASYDPAKKQQYILDTLAKLGLKEVREEYEKLNGSLIDNNEAIINQQVAMAGLNEALEPIHTMLLNIGTAFIEKITPAIEKFSSIAQKALGGDLKGTIEDVNTFIGYLVDNTWKTLSQFAQDLPSKISEMSGEIVNLVGGMLTTASTWKFDLAGIIIEALNNLLDALPTILDQVVQGIDKFLPQVIDSILGLANLIVEVAPEILKKIISIIPRLVSQVSQLLQDNLPVIIEGIKSLVDSIIELLPQLMTAITEALPSIIQLIVDFIVDNTPLIMDAIVQLIFKIVDAIPMLFDLLVVQIPHLISVLIEALIDAFPEIMEAINTIFWKLIEALPMLWSQVIDNIPQLITSVIEAFTTRLEDFVSIGGSIVQSFIEGIIGNIGSMVTGVSNFNNEIVKAFKKFFGIGNGGYQNSQLYKIGSSIIKGMIEGVISMTTNMLDTFIELGDGILEKVGELPEELGEVGKNLLEGLWGGIKDKTEWLKKKITGVGKDIIGWFKNIFDEHSPSRVMRDEIGKNLGLGIGEGLLDSVDSVLRDTKIFSDKLKFGLSDKISTIQSGLSLGQASANGGAYKTSNVNNFTQNIYAPKQPSRLELYRQTKNLLALH